MFKVGDIVIVNDKMNVSQWRGLEGVVEEVFHNNNLRLHLFTEVPGTPHADRFELRVTPRTIDLVHHKTPDWVL